MGDLKITKKQLMEDVAGGPRPLIYDVGFKSKKKANGDTIKETYLNISGLTGTDKATLTSPGFNATSRKDGSAVFYPITNDEAFLNGVSFKKMYDYLKGTGNYIMPDINIMKTEISQGKMDNISGALIKDQQNKFEDLFERIIRSLDDPKTQELLQRISSIGFNINETVYGKVRSAGNAIKAYAVKPNATFVATRKNFRKLYNRILKPNATQILLSVPGTTGRDTSKAEAELGVKYDDIKNNPHKVDSFRIASTTGMNGFTLGVFFDISDTMLIPGYPDTFTGQAGLVDNLRGILNQFALQELGANKNSTDELGITSDTNKNITFFNRFIKYLSANKGTIPTPELDKLSKMDPSKDETVVSILRAYFSEDAFAREHDQNVKNAKVYAAIASVLTVEQLANAERLKILKFHKQNVDLYLKTRKDFVSISLPVTNVCNILKPINESSMLNEITVTPEDIMSLFDINPESLQDDNMKEETEPCVKDCSEEINQIKESFFNTLNKLYKTK